MVIDPSQKQAGLMVPVFALRHAADFGIGDTLAVREAVDFCAGQGFSVLQFLPITETGGDHSPYNPLSSMALCPSLLAMTPEQVPGLSRKIIERMAPADVVARLRAGPVNYPEVKRIKWEMLAEAYAEFEAHHLEEETELATSFHEFVESQSAWLRPYTLFRALINEYDDSASWMHWRTEHREYASAERWSQSCPQSEEINRFREFYAYVQWVAFRQWAEVKIYAGERDVRLMGDMPFGISRCSADVWERQDLFDLTWSGGAPPEPFFKTDLFTTRWGQNWGIPLYRWERHRAEDFSWWRQRIAGLRHSFHDFRVDHVLGFFRIYAFPWTPDENGVYLHLSPEEAFALAGNRRPQFLPGPDEPLEAARKNIEQGEELLRMVLDAAGGMRVVAEDLGAVPKYMRESLRRLGIPGFAIPVFERNEEDQSFREIASLPELSLITFSTHDHAPMALYYRELTEQWHGPNGHEAWLELQRLMRLLGLDDEKPPQEFTEPLYTAFARALLESPCWLAVFMISDLLGTTQQFNRPGSASDSNWSERLEMPLGDLVRDPVYGARIGRVRQMIMETHRS